MGTLFAFLFVLWLYEPTREAITSLIGWLAMAFLVLAGLTGTFLFGVIVFHMSHGM